MKEKRDKGTEDVCKGINMKVESRNPKLSYREKLGHDGVTARSW